MGEIQKARAALDDALRRGAEERWERTIAAHVAAERAFADSRITTLESRLAEVERERDEARRERNQAVREGDKVLARAIDSENRCTRAMDKYRAERERAFRAERGLADAHDMLKRAHRIEAAAREAADLLGVIASEVEGDAASVYGQVRWARDARRVEASIRAALEGGGK